MTQPTPSAAADPGRPAPTPADPEPGATPYVLQPPDLGAWRAGNGGVEGVWRFEARKPGRSVLITALVHGNEICGAWALCGLLERLRDGRLVPRRGRLTLALCNLAAFDRFDPAAPERARFVEEDFNRVWQPERLADGATLERRRAAELQPFVDAADWLLDLHSMGSPCAPLQLAGLQPRHLALARALAAPEHVVRDAGHAEGCRLRDYGRFGAPDAPDACSLLIECGWHGAESSRQVAQDQCRRFLLAAGTLDAADAEAALGDWRLPDAPHQWALAVTEALAARGAAFRFTQPIEPLVCIPKAGTVIADNDGEPVATPYDDCVLVMPAAKPPRPGATAVRFARRTPIAG